MKCPVCNRENGPGVNFCEGCGRRIPRCPTCGMELTNRDRFCANDGTRLSDDLLILVPEEFVLQEPVWSKPDPDDLTENTVAVGSGRKSWDDIPPEDTVRVTAVSGGNRVQNTTAVRSGNPVDIPVWDKIDVNPDPPQRAYCENCGKRIASGNRFCSECQRERTSAAAQPSRKSGSKKSILIILMILLLLLGVAAGGYALVTSDLFDWDSSNRAEKTERDEDEDEDEDEDNGGDAAVPDDGNTVPADAPEVPTGEVPGVDDPVNPDSGTETPSNPVSDTVPTQAPTEEVSDPLMYWIENCDKMYLSEEDLQGFDKKMCTYARNACYAKSGRQFNSTELQQYFLQFDWYNPTVSPDKFSASMLNAYQTANINVVLEYEESQGFN